jgi:uroporphyrinogen decarboxylase
MIFGSRSLSKKDDFITALQCGKDSQAVPIWELEFQAWDNFSDNAVVVGTEFQALSPERQDKALHDNAEIFLRVSEELHFAGLTVPNSYWEIAPGTPSYFWLPEKARYRQIEILRDLAPDDLLMVGVSGGVMAMPSSDDYVEFAYRLHDQPDEIDEMAKNILQAGLNSMKRLSDAGVEIFLTASDIADNHGPYFNPQQMQRFILPYLAEWSEQVKAIGGYAILHTDGNIMPYIQDVADSGIHALQAIDPTAGMNMTETQQAVGERLCLCGNVDCGLLLNGKSDEVYAATEKLLRECNAGGGFVLGASNAVQPEVPAENYRALIRAWEDYDEN